MQPCNYAGCGRWIEFGEYCPEHTPAPKSTRSKSARGYDALEVRGIGIVSPRRILVHRPKSVRRNMPQNFDTGFSLDMMRDYDTPTRTRIIRANPTTIPQNATMREKIAHLRQIASLGEIGD